MISALTSKDTNFDFKMLSPAKKTLKECMEYIAQYFVPLKDGNIAVFEDGKYTLKDDSTVKKVYFNRMPKNTRVAQKTGERTALILANGFSTNILVSDQSLMNSPKMCFMTTK